MQSDLIFDLGCNNGDDTDFYLRKGFRVVAVDADRDLCDQVTERFKDAIAGARLHVVHGAITDSPADTITLHVFPKKTAFNTVDGYFKEEVEREGLRSVEVRVPVITLNHLFDRFGMPYYLKVDIEGAEIVPLRELAKWTGRSDGERPCYVSAEIAVHDLALGIEQIVALAKSGYDRFQYVNQDRIFRARVEAPVPPREGKYTEYFPAAISSGLFGRELPQKWIALSEAIKRLLELHRLHVLFRDDPRYSLNGQIGGTLRSKIYNRFRRHILNDPVAWYDLHACCGPLLRSTRAGVEQAGIAAL